MDWGDLTLFSKWLFGGWLFLLMGFILIRMASGHIILTGLMSKEKRAPYGLDRLQLVFVTLLFAAGYCIVALTRAPGDNLPDIPAPLMLVLIGSNGTYLAVKYNALMGARAKGR